MQRMLLLFFTLVTGPRRSLSLKLSDTKVYEPQIRARLGAACVPQLTNHAAFVPDASRWYQGDFGSVNCSAVLGKARGGTGDEGTARHHVPGDGRGAAALCDCVCV